jgi:hypothetical protein
MTKDEFYKKYGSIKVKFLGYFKYTFTYEAELPDGKRLTCDYGGNADDIYRHEVSADFEETVSGLQPHECSVYENGKYVEGFAEIAA